MTESMDPFDDAIVKIRDRGKIAADAAQLRMTRMQIFNNGWSNAVFEFARTAKPKLSAINVEFGNRQDKMGEAKPSFGMELVSTLPHELSRAAKAPRISFIMEDANTVIARATMVTFERQLPLTDTVPTEWLGRVLADFVNEAYDSVPR